MASEGAISRQNVRRQPDIQQARSKKRIIAEELAHALIGYWTMGMDKNCPREEAFAEMFPLLGDKAAHNQIRSASPDQKHCGLLKTDPRICLDCFIDANPYKANPKAALAAHQNRELLYEALELFGDYDLGLITNLHSLTPEEVQALRTVKQQEKFNMARLQGEVVAASLAPLFVGGSNA
jgi:hypothetical protein